MAVAIITTTIHRGHGAMTTTGENANPLRELEREHADCLAFADEIMRIADTGDFSEMADCVARVSRYNIDELEPHLQHEEQTILRPLIQDHPQHTPLCVTIGREHGLLRTLVEGMTLETAAEDLAEFGRVLKAHTLLEDRELFPLVEELFSDEQLASINSFTPFRRAEILQNPAPDAGAVQGDSEWLSALEQHFEGKDLAGGSIVLFPRYNPDFSRQMAERLELSLFDFQKEVMAELGKKADAMSLQQLTAALRERAAESGIVAHNVEALLCVKPEQERADWLRSFLETEWPNPVVLPIMVFQSDAPREHERICDLELHTMPKQSVAASPEPDSPVEYHFE
ncbi:MAG: hypothetical protein DSZ33_03730 [Gammaproteobacteria bacterium]|nr:MAG: hypothetical protein DSZ33_03730 [Gammaproteobacteria bacterium]